MPWYKIVFSFTKKEVFVAMGLWVVFFFILLGVFELSQVKYRLCEIRYTISDELYIHGKDPKDFSQEVIAKNIREYLGEHLIFTLRRVEERLVASLFFPQTILSQEKISQLDSYLRTRFSHVEWWGPEVRTIPTLQPWKRHVLMGLLSLAMVGGIFVASHLRREL